ncbi:LOW QUALITY PROTEIN: hypothetical protein PHMEG_00013518 [Phytophthora megakarya]|uniref:Peptidase A2 domain-containing protein n=1 Tax=Phytophthora megakarya TaxID=4795 RepID=A0A225W634_9STRA|nr:LOW QUALITY PROTEIN: hypothetical protein PHMEG_00013518 [Phytophthora megakarya]
MPHGRILQSDTQMVRSDSTRRAVPRASGEDIKLERSPGWNPVRAERSKYCIYAYANKATTDRGRKESDLRGNTCNLHSYAANIASLPRIGEFGRSDAEVALDLKRGESRGVNQERAILLLDTGAEVSILDTTFARTVGCHSDTSQGQECVGIGDNIHTSEERTKIKITLAGYLVYFFDIWIGDLSGQNAILGMDFMVPAGVCMGLADESMRLPDEVGTPLNGRMRLYSEKISNPRKTSTNPGWTVGRNSSEHEVISYRKLWVTRGERWVPTVTEGPGRTRYLIILNIGETFLRLDHRLDVGMILDQDKVPRSPGYILDREPPEASEGPEKPAVQTPKYTTPRLVLRRAEPSDINRDRTLISTLKTRSLAETTNAAQIEERFPNPYPPTPPTNPNSDRYRSGDAGGGGISESLPDQAPDRTGTKDIEPKTENPNCQTGIKPESGKDYGVNTQIHPTEGVDYQRKKQHRPPSPRQNTEDDDDIYYHESGDLSAEDLTGNIAMLPESPISTIAEVSSEDLQVGNSESATLEEIEKLWQIIWKKQHLLIGERPTSGGQGRRMVIDARNAKPIASRSRKAPTRFREKVAGLVKGLLAAEIIRPSTSPWASPIVIVRKRNGVDIRLCTDYKLVNGLTRLMVYPIPLISDLKEEDLDKALWYCSLDMTSGFWAYPRRIELARSQHLSLCSDYSNGIAGPSD